MGVLETDGYKFSMAEVGWPLRQETFVYTHRKGGAQIMPIDLRKHIRDLLPEPSAEDYAYLQKNQYAMGEGFSYAMAEEKKNLIVNAIPKGSVFYAGEPPCTVTGASALGSWLEPHALQINYRVQVATLAMQNRAQLEAEVAKVTCEKQKEIILETLEEMKIPAPKIQVCSAEYQERVFTVVTMLVKAVKNPDRLFEVGFRSATCLEQHEIALRACKEAGVLRTSNVHLAKKLGMIPVGTMGHEHVSRYGSDEAAFRAMKERRPHRSSYLPDTYDFFLCGLPAAFRVMQEDPDRQDSIRYDSGNKPAQFIYTASQAKYLNLRPRHVIEDGLDLEQTWKFETLREQIEVAPEDVFYGYGGFIVASPAWSSLTRDRVQAVWKLSQTGTRATMKFSSDPGKESLPGRPVVWRRTSGRGPIGIIGQEGEAPPEGYVELTGRMEPLGQFTFAEMAVELSPGTLALKTQLRAELARMRASGGMAA